MKHVLVYGMTDNPGGIETYLLNFFQRVQGKAVMLDFVSDFPAISGCEILEKGGAKLHFIPAKSKDLKGHLLGMWRILRQHREYETVYFNILDAGAAITMLPVFLAGRKIVVHSHNNNTEKRKLHEMCRPLAGMLTRGRAACSESAAQYMFGKKWKHSLIVPNGIDAGRFRFNSQVRQMKRQALGVDDRFVICHVGRLAVQKNPMGLLDIFEVLHSKNKDAVLVSVGTGELAEQFAQEIARRGLEDAVMCLGARGDVDQIMQAADVFVFPSLYEGLGIVVLEAQAAGLPCVISDAIPGQVAVTDLVHPVSLTAPVDSWVEEIEKCRGIVRRDTYPEMCGGGWDISCCEDFDNKLVSMFQHR